MLRVQVRVPRLHLPVLRVQADVAAKALLTRAFPIRQNLLERATESLEAPKGRGARRASIDAG